jgi:ActR/RegA family two-component response regulator
VRLKDEWLLPPDDQVFVRSVEAAAANRGVQGGIAPSLRFTDPETSLAVFHGASPWYASIDLRQSFLK